ncbi:translation initiation factor IF-2 [Leptospira santarosai]|uniref:translation initiation factor IF-2 n=1 Tax=Leptospira santarosai TaxID=28183 RepID=UPI000248AFEA|nr:translation initiation factor IF-2 [Leptospira santarosai]EMM76446.1 translation initiation factor IF-2 [Leptospira santarosai str. 2000030832]MDI7189849.1 translation initiation factor IF-2 [Leptospira santarosai]MDI7206740.1 translation initiation factor IF-2 [Leptospira santarosai]MDI7210530.1 translation initiation factor IF-2 [Leptospira santarosai]
MEDKNKTIKETLQGTADAGKRKKLVIKKKGDENSAPSASPKKGTIAESAPVRPVTPFPHKGDSDQSPIVRPAPKEVKYEDPSRKQDSGQSGSTRSPKDKDSQGRSSGDSSYPVSRSPFQKEDSNIIVSRPIQRSTPRPNTGGQGNRGPSQGGGYQGNRGPGQGGGYQGNRGPGQGSGYQGNRGPGQGGGYQGNRGPGQGSGYQGNRGPGQAGPGNRFGGSGPGNRSGGPGGRPMPITSAEVELSQARGAAGASKKKGHDKEKTSSDKRDFSGAENTKFFKQRFKKTKVVGVSGISVPKEITVLENVQVGELAKKMNLKPGDVIGKLMKMGMMVTINNIIDSETASLLADEYGCKVKVVSLYEETIIEEEKDNEEDYINRPPVVTIMGHVDHGKTKLLDTIRRSSVIDTESGGITQHIGAYQVKTARGLVTFLDTPGHEAFTSMRARGAKVTDIVILVVAADDGVMPQTLEAISHAKAAEVPIIVAINKIDLPSANPDKIMQELANHGLQSEEWGGQTMYVKISARENIGIDKLLEVILLQAEVMDLKSNPKRRAKGTIIEAKLDPGRGSVATVLIQNGTLRVGDPFVAGVFSGRVRAMYNDLGQLIEEAGPAFPAQVTGIDGVPDAGAPFDAMADEKEARNISQHRIEFERIGNSGAATGTSSKVTLENMNEFIKQGALKELKVIIKADVRGSAEAIKESLGKLSTPEVKLNVIQSGAGAIVDMDVMLASASNALIIGFHVRANPKTIALAEKEGVQIKYYNIIYQVVDEIKLAMEGLLEPEKIEEVIGTAEIREIFKVSKIGNIAGCMVTSGKIQKSANVRVIGDGVTKFEGKLKSLKRVKDDVNDVVSGFECGIQVDGYNDFKVGDTIEAYNVTVIKRKLE